MRKRNVDFRLVLGILLVAGSIAGVVALISALDRSEPVYVAVRPIASGELIRAEDVAIERLNLGESTSRYLVPDGDFSPVRTARAVEAGELIPLRSLGEVDPEIVNTVVSVTGPIPADLTAGSVVDVWAAPSGSLQGDDLARMIATAAEVVEIRDAAGFASQATSELELRLERNKLPELLAAVARGEYVTVVQVAR